MTFSERSQEAMFNLHNGTVGFDRDKQGTVNNPPDCQCRTKDRRDNAGRKTGPTVYPFIFSMITRRASPY
jgi:hypothetical protein